MNSKAICWKINRHSQSWQEVAWNQEHWKEAARGILQCSQLACGQGNFHQTKSQWHAKTFLLSTQIQSTIFKWSIRVIMYLLEGNSSSSRWCPRSSTAKQFTSAGNLFAETLNWIKMWRIMVAENNVSSGLPLKPVLYMEGFSLSPLFNLADSPNHCSSSSWVFGLNTWIPIIFFLNRNYSFTNTSEFS